MSREGYWRKYDARVFNDDSGPMSSGFLLVRSEDTHKVPGCLDNGYVPHGIPTDEIEWGAAPSSKETMFGPNPWGPRKEYLVSFLRGIAVHAEHPHILINGKLMNEAADMLEASIFFGAATQPEKDPSVEEELVRLRWWKQQALEVMSGLQDLGRELGLRPGEQITGPAAARKARHMRKALEQIADPDAHHSERAQRLAQEGLR